MFDPINIWAKRPGQAETLSHAQQAVWNIVSEANISFLCEYRGGAPFPVQHLVPEAFLAAEGASIPSRTLKERLPMTLRLARKAGRDIYGKSGVNLESFVAEYQAFVDRCEDIEAETGVPPLVFTQQDRRPHRTITMM